MVIIVQMTQLTSLSETSPASRQRGHWILAGALLMLVLITTAAALIKLPRTYESNSAVVLLASPAASVPNGGNPYLSFSQSLTLTAELLSEEITAPGVVRELAAHGVAGSYTVTLAPYSTTTTGSVLLVDVNGSSEAGAEFSLQTVTAQISKSLSGLQAGERSRDRIRAVTISMDRTASLSAGDLMRTLGMILVVGLALALAAFRAVVAVTRRRDRQTVPSHRQSAPPGSWALPPRFSEDNPRY